MQPFQLQIPTQARFGVGVLASLGTETARLGKNALLVYGKQSIKRNGVYDTVMASLREAGVSVTEHPGVKPNPVLAHVEEGALLAKRAGADVVVAVGGGSVIDAAKAIALGARETGDLWDFFTRKRTVSAALPLLAVQTVPASSSEMNAVSVITNDATKQKFSVRSPLLFPKIAFLDPALTTTIPMEYTAYACTDILSHMMEGYFTSTDPWAPVQDGMVEGISRAVIDSTDRLLLDPTDLQARSAIMWAGALAWSGLVNAGVGGATIPNHMLEHPLSAHHDIAHGAGLSIIIPGWLKFARDRVSNRIIRFGREILRMGESLSGLSEAAQADLVISTLEQWYKKIGTPITFAEGGITEPLVDEYTVQAMVLGKTWGVPGYTEQDIREVYRLCGA